MLIGIICWVVLGLIAGFIASKVVNLRDEDPKAGILLGGICGVIGGWIFNMFGAAGAVGFNLWSLLVNGSLLRVSALLAIVPPLPGAQVVEIANLLPAVMLALEVRAHCAELAGIAAAPAELHQTEWKILFTGKNFAAGQEPLLRL